MRSGEALLHLNGVHITRGGRRLWRGLDLRVQGGEFVAVLGGNGSGKSTLLETILGLRKPTAGEVLFGGRPIGRGNPRIGFVPQKNEQAFAFRGLDLVRMAVRTGWGGLKPLAGNRRAEAVLDSLGALELARRPFADLSGGQQQRIRIAQALVGEPRLLLCDEPLASLDVAAQSEVCALLDRIRRTSGAAVIMVTHEIKPIVGLVNRVLHAGEDGKHSESGTAGELLLSGLSLGQPSGLSPGQPSSLPSGPPSDLSLGPPPSSPPTGAAHG